MGIDIRIEDEHGNLWDSADKSTLSGSPDYLNWLLSSIDISGTVCLRFIDRYGDTIFNRAQAKELFDELALVKTGISDEAIAIAVARNRKRLLKQGVRDSEPFWFPNEFELNAFVERLRTLIQIAVQYPHGYIRFVGD